MKNLKFAIGIPTILLLVSCASGPTKSQLTHADYGQETSIEECKAIAETIVSRDLKDPSSAQFSHSQCFKGYWGSVPIMGIGVAFGWVQKGQVNAKNSFGGYVGFRPYQVLIKNRQVIRYCVSNKDGLCIPRGN